MPDVDLFQAVDLWEGKDIAGVTRTIFALGRTVSPAPASALPPGLLAPILHFSSPTDRVLEFFSFSCPLSPQCYKHPEWRGPCLGPRPAEENRREFSEETLRAGEAIIGLQAGQNKGATQAGQSFGATRKILLGK